MRLDNQRRIWINCRTKEEQEKILDIFERIGARWPRHQMPRETESRQAPMHYLLDYGTIRHGRTTVTKQSSFVELGATIVEAKDFHNQWVSMMRANEIR